MCQAPTALPEPTIDELLSDPIARLLMEGDRLRPEVVWTCVRDARRKLKARSALGSRALSPHNNQRTS